MDLSIKQVAGIIIAVIVVGVLVTYAKGGFTEKIEHRIDQEINSIGK